MALRKYDRMGIGLIDIALWDFAGKYYDAPIHELLGTYRERLRTYASTYQGDQNGGLDSPEAYADFAEECLEMGYPAYKIHDWGGDWLDVERTVETVHAVGERVGDEMDLMIDPACELETWSDALKVGKACDEQGFFWYEDPFSDAGISQHASRNSPKSSTARFYRPNTSGGWSHTRTSWRTARRPRARHPEYDAGIMGAMKIAHAAESLGLDVEFHAPGPAHRHCIAATRNANYYEMALVGPKCENTQPPVYLGDYADQLDSIDSEGTVPVPDGPGLGIEYDWEFIQENRLGGRVYE